MSADKTTVKQLKDWLQQYPDDMVVVTEPQWESYDPVEGEVDGIGEPFAIWGHEVRSGWNSVDEKLGKDCAYGCVKEDDAAHEKLLVIPTKAQDYNDFFEFWEG